MSFGDMSLDEMSVDQRALEMSGRKVAVDEMLICLYTKRI